MIDCEMHFKMHSLLSIWLNHDISNIDYIFQIFNLNFIKRTSAIFLPFDGTLENL